MDEKVKIKPSALFYGLGIVFFAIGALLMMLMIISAVMKNDDPKISFTLPGESIVKLEDSGRQKIYYEYLYAFKLDEDIVFTFQNTETGETVMSEFAKHTGTYSFNGRNGLLVANVLINEPGEYRISSSYKGDEELAFAMGDFVAKFVIKISSALAIMFSFSFVGLVIIIITAVKRDKFARRLSST